GGGGGEEGAWGGGGGGGGNPAEEVVVLLFRRRLLEALNADTLGIHGADHMPACAILAGAVDALQHDKKAMTPIGVQLTLQRGYARQIAVKLGLGVLGVLPFAVEGCVYAREFDWRTRRTLSRFVKFITGSPPAPHLAGKAAALALRGDSCDPPRGARSPIWGCFCKPARTRTTVANR